jgi:hypothetical protein
MGKATAESKKCVPGEIGGDPVTFYEWYHDVVAAKLYADQQPYERESVIFQAIEKLTSEDILVMFSSMKEPDLRLALFDHVKSCIAEQWDPSADDDFSDET